MKCTSYRSVVCLVILVGAAVLAADSGNSQGVVSVKVSVDGIRGKQGQIKVGLFHREGFPRDERMVLYGAVSAITASNQTVVLTGVTPGDYAILAYHDENGNGRMDCDMIGRPKEGYGVSRNARRHWRAPDYDEAKVAVTPERNEFVIRLGY